MIDFLNSGVLSPPQENAPDSQRGSSPPYTPLATLSLQFSILKRKGIRT